MRPLRHLQPCQLENQLSLALGLIFNIIVLGFAIDPKLSAAYVAVFIVLTFMQWSLRRPVARAYLENQRMTNRVTAHGYTAWDNIFSGNRYNPGSGSGPSRRGCANVCGRRSLQSWRAKVSVRPASLVSPSSSR